MVFGFRKLWAHDNLGPFLIRTDKYASPSCLLSHTSAV